MKVLHQIIDYLRGRGLLSQEQLVELASQGILPWDEVYEARAEEVRAEVPEWEEPEEVPEPAARPRARPGRAVPRVPVLGPRELCARLAAHFDTWGGPLEGLVRLGRRAGCTTWTDTAVAVRNSELDQLADLLAEALQGRELGLPGLWEALEMDGYRGVLAGEEAHGPAPNAYRALLAVHDPANLGRHAVLLREPEVAAVFNLMHAQRRLLRAAGELLRRRPDLAAAALRRAGPTPVYWACVLVHSARRGTPGRRPWPSAGEHPPPRSPPDEAAWPRLWAQAVAMDPAAATPFLIERTRLHGERPRALCQTVTQLVSSLEDRAREVLFRYYQRDCAAGQVATLMGWAEADVVRVLQGFRQDLRQALSGHPATRVFLQPAPARSWEAYLTDCLRCTWDSTDYLFDPRREEKYAELLRTHYGPAFDLLCPQAWD
jgi:hypothetical protein